MEHSVNQILYTINAKPVKFFWENENINDIIDKHDHTRTLIGYRGMFPKQTIWMIQALLFPLFRLFSAEEQIKLKKLERQKSIKKTEKFISNILTEMAICIQASMRLAENHSSPSLLPGQPFLWRPQNLFSVVNLSTNTQSPQPCENEQTLQ